MPEGPAVVWVTAVALVAADGRVLMQRRRLDRAHGGLWEFPGGKIEPGESPESAAAREISEELGVPVDPASLQPAGFASDSAIPAESGSSDASLRRTHVILLYLCRHWQGEPRCLDAEEIGWFAPDTLERLAMPPLDYPLARALQKVI